MYHREIFPMASRGMNESNKEKAQEFTTTIYSRRFKTRGINDLST